LKGIYPEEPRGLYVVQHGPHRDALLASYGLAGEGFQGLVVPSDVSDIPTGKISIVTALRILELWSYARLAGFLPEDRRNRIVKKLHATIYEKLCGANWSRAEAAVVDNPTESRAREALLERIGGNQGFNAEIQMKTHKFHSEIAQTVEWYTDLARRYGVCKDSSLCEFAVILAREPHTLPDKDSDDLGQLTRKSISNPEVLRAVRYASIVNSLENDQDTRGDLIGRERWS